MRALVYPADGYISNSIIRHLERTGHEVISWQPAEQSVKDSCAAWDAALQQAQAVFHVLYGHEAHARDTVQRLLRYRTNAIPATFLGITTPLAWAATPVPPLHQKGLATGNSNLTNIISSDRNSGGGSAEDQHTQDGTAADSPTAGAALLTERDAPNRRSAAAALSTYHVEQLILRCNRPGRLHTYIICPGILYGVGEDDGQLHSLFKTAWEGREPLMVLGAGTNRLPTTHVADLASYAATIAQLQPRDIQYLLFADDDSVQQRELVGAVAQLLGGAKIVNQSPVDALLHSPPSPLLQLDLPFATSQLPAGIERCCPRGPLQQLPQVLTEYLAARHLTPLRILIRGPPTSGKSYLGARLSELYGLKHINTANILAELPLMDQDTQKAANAQLASKEGRISPQIFAKMAQHLLARHPEAANQGWVMEGWPKSLQAARLFCGEGASDGSSKGLGSPDRCNRRTTGGVNKDKKPSGTGSSSGGAVVLQPGAKNRRTTMADDPVDSAVTLQNPDLVPQYLIELEVPEDELIRRVRAIAAAEAAAAAAAATLSTAPTGKATSARGASSKPVSAKGGPLSTAGGTLSGDKGGAVAGVVGSHNNEKDWCRRMEAYKQLIQEDSADLAANRAAILDAVRAATATPDSSSSAAGSPGRHKRDTSGGGKGGTAASVDLADLPPDVRLPEHGGFVGYFVDSGCKYLHVKNTYDEKAAAAAAAVTLIGPRVQPEQQQQQSDQLQPQQRAVLPPLHIERQLREWIGPPHNYKGFPDHREAPDSSAATDPAVRAAASAADILLPADHQRGYSRSLTVPGLNLSGPEGHNGQLVPQDWVEVLEVARVLTAEQAARAHTKLHSAAQPLVSTLLSGVMPALMTGLVKTALHRPQDPWQVIADELLKAAEQIEASYKDPYDDPSYAVQLAKVEAKAAREAARAEAAAAKVAREEAARAAAVALVEAEAAAAAAAATPSSCGSGGQAAARNDLDVAAGSRPASAIGGAKSGAAKSAAGKAAAAGSRPASMMRPR